MAGGGPTGRLARRPRGGRQRDDQGTERRQHGGPPENAGVGEDERSLGRESPQRRPDCDAQRDADQDADGDDRQGHDQDGGGALAAREPEGAEDGEVTGPAPHGDDHALASASTATAPTSPDTAAGRPPSCSRLCTSAGTSSASASKRSLRKAMSSSGSTPSAASTAAPMKASEAPFSAKPSAVSRRVASELPAAERRDDGQPHDRQLALPRRRRRAPSRCRRC